MTHITFPDRSKRKSKRKKQILTPEEKQRKKAYQRQYYLDHIEKAKEYQRRYNRKHKKPTSPKVSDIKYERELRKTSYTQSDFQKTSAEKIPNLVRKIILEEATLTI